MFKNASAQQFVGLIAQHLLIVRTKMQKLTVQGGLNDKVVGLLNEHAIAFFALPQRLLHPLALRV